MLIDVIIYGDQHYDLKSEGLDRTDDIDQAHNHIIDYAIDLKEQGKNVLVLNMGDVFHGTRPRAEVLGRVIRSLNKLENKGIETYIIAGNHDVIDAKDRTSALEPLYAIGYEHIHIIHDITLFNYPEGYTSPLTVVTLPHISKAKAVFEGYKGVQEYIDTLSTNLEKLLPEKSPVIVIGHMNIAGAKTGTESYMIKGAHEDFPEVLKKSKKVNYIFNGHIHRPQLIPNLEGAPIVITGDIQTNDFGERLDQKQFFHLEVEI